MKCNWSIVSVCFALWFIPCIGKVDLLKFRKPEQNTIRANTSMMNAYHPTQYYSDYVPRPQLTFIMSNGCGDSRNFLIHEYQNIINYNPEDETSRALRALYAQPETQKMIQRVADRFLDNQIREYMKDLDRREHRRRIAKNFIRVLLIITAFACTLIPLAYWINNPDVTYMRVFVKYFHLWLGAGASMSAALFLFD